YALPPLAQQSRDLIDHLPELGAAITDFQERALEWYRSLPLPEDLRHMIDESIASAEAAFAEAVRAILGPAFSTLLRTAAFGLGPIVIPVWLFFTLKDRDAFPRTVRRALPESW